MIFQKKTSTFAVCFNPSIEFIMAVQYVLHPKGNPSNPEAPKKIYAQAKASGSIDLKKLSREIAETSTVNDTDVLAVLNDLTKALRRHLSDGKIVHLGDFGRFQIAVSSEGVESEEKFHVSLIKGAKINFRPGEDLTIMCNNLKYEKQKI